MESTARLFIIGIGPGDPELLTIRAARLLAHCETIFHAGPRDDAGFAFEVVAPLLRADQRARGMALAMRRGRDEGTSAAVGYDRVARAMIAEAEAGGSAAFLTEGDPSLYGSGSYVVEELRAIAPGLAVEVVPGVSAICAAAARLGWPLAQKEEILTVCPATYHAGDLGAILDRPGPVCWLKPAGVLPVLVEELRRRGRLDRSALIERIGRPDERIFLDLDAAMHETLSYFSIVLTREAETNR